MNEGKLVSAAVVAEQLGMTRVSIYRLAQIGKIPFFQAGAKLSGRRFDVAEVRTALRVGVKESGA